jgi:galactokinase/mevalonate kinase-like predicted kinase
MQLIRRHACARVGLIGNPSDGYHGKTISAIFPRFRADVVLYEWPTVEVMWSQEDQSRFASVHELARDVELHGYYGGVRLVKATIKRFVEYCDAQGLSLHERNFSVRYRSSIPRQVGLAGSSAIIIATLRALMEFYEIDVPKEVLPSLALSVETGELGIAAGLQDRVIQVYEGVVFMDFDKDQMVERHGFRCGVYEPLDPARLPALYVAFSSDAGEPGEVVHNPLRERWLRGDPQVHAAMQRFAELTVLWREALAGGDVPRMKALMNENFETRRSICTLARRHVEMVERAQAAGASAKFAGSGGAIVGIYDDEAMLSRLRTELTQIGCDVYKLSPSGKP